MAHYTGGVFGFEKDVCIATSTAWIYVAIHCQVFTPLYGCTLYNVVLYTMGGMMYWLCTILMTSGLVFNLSTMVGVIYWCVEGGEGVYFDDT